MKNRSAGIICLVVLTVLLGVIASAQDYRGKVQGVVTDPTQAAVANAAVVLRNLNTGIEQNRQTDSTGRYLFDFVQPGTYSVTVTAAGFQKFIQSTVTVLTAGDVTVNAQLAVGGVAETAVEVGGNGHGISLLRKRRTPAEAAWRAAASDEPRAAPIASYGMS